MLGQQTSRHASASSENVPSPTPLRAAATELGTDAATGYELPARQQPPDTTTEHGGAPDSELPPPPPARRTDDGQGLDAFRPPLSAASAGTVSNGDPVAG